MEKQGVFVGRWVLLASAMILLSVLFVVLSLAQGEKGLVACWKFEEGEGDRLLDVSGNGNHGTIHGATWAEGRVGGGLQFDGEDDYVAVPKSASLDGIGGEITLMCWIKTPLTGRHSILARWLYGGGVNQRSLELDVDSDGNIVNFALSPIGSGGSWCESSNTIPANEWAHLAATSDGETMRIYINGELDPATSSAPSRIHPSTGDLHIGAWYTDGSWHYFFEGVMDEMSIYSRALTDQEILEDYREGSPQGIVAGAVMDANGNPAEGINVDVGRFSAATDEGGKYAVSVPVGTYEVRVFGKGYRREISADVAVKEGETTVVDRRLIEDKTPPALFEVRAEDVAPSTAAILWETDEPCNSIVRYGTVSGAYDQTTEDASYVTAHRIALTGLDSDTKTYFTVESTDGAENTARSAEYTFTTQKEGGVAIWDAGEHYQGFWDAFANSFKNRAAWAQVSYGKTDYEFRGDTVLENKFFYISFNAHSQDELHVKRDGGTMWRNVFYRCYYPEEISVGGVKRYASSTRQIRILKYSQDEAIVEHTGGGYPIVTTYRIFKDKPWVEVNPVEKAHMLGIHGKVRMGLVPIEGGNDYVIDSLRDPPDLYVPPEGRLIICFFESPRNPFMWVLTFPSFERARTYFNCDSGPGGDTMWADGGGTWGGLTMPGNWDGCITATYSRFGDQRESVVEGALAYWNNWYREQVDQAIKEGETYTSPWKPPYPGRWRMTARVAEKRYTQGFAYSGTTKFPAKYFSQDVYDGNFTFTSPIAGHLDYIIMYMYDRTEDTPSEILTPMDQYRWTVGHETGIGEQGTERSFEAESVPKEVALFQNVPNPFNPRTVIRYEVPEPCRVRLTVYNTAGQVVKGLMDERKEAGSYRVVWDGGDDLAGSGLFFCRLEAGDWVRTIKMVRVK